MYTELNCESTSTNESLLLAYEQVDQKDDITTTNIVKDILEDNFLLEYVEQGLVSLVTDAALLSFSGGMSRLNTNSICVLHNTHRVCENTFVNLKRLFPSLREKLDRIDKFILVAKKKHSRSHMKKHNIPEAKRSLNVYLKVSSLIL